MTAIIQKWGNSLAVRIPRFVARQMQLNDGDEVELRIENKDLIVRSTRRPHRLRDLVQKITKSNRHAETGWGKPVGRELW